MQTLPKTHFGVFSNVGTEKPIADVFFSVSTSFSASGRLGLANLLEESIGSVGVIDWALEVIAFLWQFMD